MLSRYIRLHIGSNLPPKDNLQKEDKSYAPKVSFILTFHCSIFLHCNPCIVRNHVNTFNNILVVATTSLLRAGDYMYIPAICIFSTGTFPHFHNSRERGFSVASFPGRSHPQYLIAYSMQIRRGKAWEISSRAVTSGRQKVDTRGAVPDSSNC